MLDESPENMTGVERAAIFLMSIGEEEAAMVMKHMGPKEVQAVGMSMAELSNVTQDHAKYVMNDFIKVIQTQTALGVDSDDYVRKMLEGALGADKASGMIDRILLGRNSKGLEQLKWMEARSVAEFVRLEHPQIIAIVLSYLESEQSAEVLGHFPERVRSDIMMRIASLDGIQPAALKELDEVMERQFSGKSNAQTSSIGGIKTAAEILNLVEGSIEADIMDQIKEVDADLGQQIQDKMFVFDNLNEVDDRGIQALLREVSTDNLLLALKAAEEQLKEKIFKNMSKRAAEMLKDDLEASGPVKLSEVEGAQKEIISIARRMSDAGEIMLGGGGDEMV
ncbi:MAG: flagellar motor switch protein FliG [Methylococcales bacterium]|jgi:flagellar motor switch protein FliG|nr:flagellar motor switch protein FliG [Methylococcales bacterium]MBT7442727.1 flagellar motor switch protein FliG [Methylococcales bacterium]